MDSICKHSQREADVAFITQYPTLCIRGKGDTSFQRVEGISRPEGEGREGLELYAREDEQTWKEPWC